MANGELFQKLLNFSNTELGQEVQEGTMGAVMQGAGLLGTDTPAPEILLKTLGGIAGGIGIGMLGKTIGARIGARLHEGALKNQSGHLANIGRMLGQKTIQGGVEETMRYGKGAIKRELVEQSSAQLMHEALQDPVKFGNKYGITQDELATALPQIKALKTAHAAVETYTSLPVNQRKALADQLTTSLGKVESVINKDAAANFDAYLKRALEEKEAGGSAAAGAYKDLASTIAGLQGPTDITGEHVGRAAGRFFGDEIGVITGMGLGGVAAGALGIKSDKDKKIEQLQQQLGNRYY